MEKMKPIDYKILWELIKNSRRSDRELAKTLGVSQPTVTRRRGQIEKYAIEGYTAIPKWGEIGFELCAFTFVKLKSKHVEPIERNESRKICREWLMNQPNVVFAGGGQGMGWDDLVISFHKSYSDFANFIRRHDSELSEFVSESQSFIIDLNPGDILKSLHFKYLADTK